MAEKNHLVQRFLCSTLPLLSTPFPSFRMRLIASGEWYRRVKEPTLLASGQYNLWGAIYFSKFLLRRCSDKISSETTFLLVCLLLNPIFLTFLEASQENTNFNVSLAQKSLTKAGLLRNVTWTVGTKSSPKKQTSMMGFWGWITWRKDYYEEGLNFWL